MPSSTIIAQRDAKSQQSLTLANATLVLSDKTVRGFVVISGGVITQTGEGTDIPDGAIDCAGDYVIPGLVELHTDNLERHLEPRPQVDWPHLPAILAHDAELASTGITTVFDALRVGSLDQDKGTHRVYARALADELAQVRQSGCMKVSHFLHLRAETCSETLDAELAQFGPSDHVGIVSLMDHTPGQRQFRDMQALRVFWLKKRSMSDADFDEHVARLKHLQFVYRDKHVESTIAAVKRFGAVLASHDDTTTDQVVFSKNCGVRYAEFPTTVEAAEACRKHDIAIMMGAPNIIRGQSHSGNVSAAELAQRGLLDIVSSDYVPASLLLSAFRLSEQWRDVPRAIACVSSNPAAAAGLEDRGRIQTGLRGDLVRVGMIDSTPYVRGVWHGGDRVA